MTKKRFLAVAGILIASCVWIQYGTAAPPVADGLVVRLDGSQLETEIEQPLTPLLFWPDRSGRDNHAGQSLLEDHPHPKLAPGVTPAGGPAVRFSGSGEFLDVASSADFEGPDRTFYIVFRDHGGANHRRLLATGYENPEGALHYNDLNGSMLSGGNHRVWGRNHTGGFSAAVVERTLPQEFAIAGGVWEPGGDLTAIWIDRNQNRGTGSATGAESLAENHIVTRIGAQVTNGATPALGSNLYLAGDIAEIVYFNRVLSFEERTAVENYLFTRHFTGGAAGQLPVTEGLVLWLDASEVLLDDPPESITRITQWTDQSGRGNHASEAQQAEGLLPRLREGATPTGQNTIAFDGAQFLEIPGNMTDFDGPELTWYLVFRPGNLTGHDRLINSAYSDLGTGDFIPYYRAWASLASHGDRYRAVGASQFADFTTVDIFDVLSLDSFSIAGNAWDSNSAELHAVTIDPRGNRVAATESGVDGNPTFHLFTRIGAGAAADHAGVVSPLNGEIAEILIYNRLLTEQEQAEVEAYLFEKHIGVPEGFQTWRAAHFAPEQLANPEISGAEAAPAGDGIPNLVKYAAGLDPWASLAAGEIVRVGFNEELVVWPDLSGQENHARQSELDSHALPSLATGATPAGGAAVRFDKAMQEYLEVPGSEDFSGSELTWYVVARANSQFGMDRHGRMLSSVYGNVGSGAWGDSETLASMLSSGNRFRSRGRSETGTSLFTDVSAPLIAPGNFMIGGTTWNAETGMEAFTVDRDGARHLTTNSSVNGRLSQHRHLRVGGMERFFDGDIAEVLFFNRLLTASEQTALEDYLHARHFAGGSPVDMPISDGLVLWLDATEVVLHQGLTLGFQRSKDAFDVDFIVEVSEDLISWDSGPDLTQEISVIDQGTTEWVTVQAKSLPGDKGCGFMRLRVVLSE